MISLTNARTWCQTAHGAQKYGNHPYQYHLDAVENVAVRFGFTDDVIRIACQGHDVLEDTKSTQSDMLAAGFPQEAVDIIFCVTDEPGATRSERKAKTLPKIAANRKAVIVKLCDRIANVEECKSNNPSQFDKYKHEFAELERQLRNRSESGIEPLWQHLEQLFA
jgi:(p)ppGpp synthase/HD superfamily hydrolase